MLTGYARQGKVIDFVNSLADNRKSTAQLGFVMAGVARPQLPTCRRIRNPGMATMRLQIRDSRNNDTCNHNLGSLSQQ